MKTPRLTGIRYDVPLREGGSVPAVVGTAEDGQYVVKFLGAGQGAKALVAEMVAAGLARALDLPVPKPAVVALAEGFGRNEPDPEIQDILQGSVGENFGLAYLSGAFQYDPAVERDISPALAADIVWFDAYITNVDRTPRNPNLLWWRDQLWMIDHGASLFIHHGWSSWEGRVQSRFPQIKDHVLLHIAGPLEEADERLRPQLNETLFQAIASDLPDAWLEGDTGFESLEAHRERYVIYLRERLNGPRDWLQEAIDAKARGHVPHTERVSRRVG